MLSGVLAASFVALANEAKTETCDAGHGCSITCSNGCGAIWWEPDGPCSTFCSDEKAKGERASFSGAKLTGPELRNLLQKPKAKKR
jgi:hypothetical protein